MPYLKIMQNESAVKYIHKAIQFAPFG